LAKTEGKAKTKGEARRLIARRREPARARAARPAGAAAGAAGLAVGNVVRCDGAGVWVDYPGNARGPVLARTMLPAEGSPARAVPPVGQTVVLMLGRGADAAPVLLGSLQPLGAAADAPARLELGARDEIVLRCGEASIVLRANGRVVVRGAYVETRAKGVNRIKGGSVSIN
jgi:hypothetical protein